MILLVALTGCAADPSIPTDGTKAEVTEKHSIEKIPSYGGVDADRKQPWEGFLCQESIVISWSTKKILELKQNGFTQKQIGET